MKISFVIPGAPVAKARHRSVPLLKCRDCGKMTRARVCRACGSTNLEFLTAVPYTEKETARFENLVKLCGMQAMREAGLTELLSGPLKMTVHAYFLIPQSRAKKLKEGDWHTQKPDRKNVLASVEDGLNKVVYYDDALACDGPIRKFWSPNPRTEVEIETL